jgi:hypothetical protein
MTTTTRLLHAAGLTVAATLALSATGEPPPPAAPPASPLSAAAAIAASDVLATDGMPVAVEALAPAAAPRWPDDWPSLDPRPWGSSAGTQTMGTGDVDVVVPSPTFPGEQNPAVDEAVEFWRELLTEPPETPGPPAPSGDPDPPDFFEEGRPVHHVPGEPGFRSVHITRGPWKSQYAPPERVPALEGAAPIPPSVAPRPGPGEGAEPAAPGPLAARPPAAPAPAAGAGNADPDEDGEDDDDFDMYVTPFPEPADDPEDVLSDEDLAAWLERAGKQIKGEDPDAPSDDEDGEEEEGEGDGDEDGDDFDMYVTPPPVPAPDPEDAPSQDEEDAGLDRLGRQIQGGDEAGGEDDGETDLMTLVGRMRELGAEKRDLEVRLDLLEFDGADPEAIAVVRQRIAEVDAQMATVRQTIQRVRDGEPEEPAPAAAAPEPPPPPDPPMVVDEHVPEMRPGYQLWSPDGTPLPSVKLGEEFMVELWVLPGEAPAGATIEATLRSVDGAEQKIVLERVDEPSPDGMVRFVTPAPVSIGGEWGNMDYPGTITGLGLDLSDSDGSHVVRISAPGVTGGTSTIQVYGDGVRQGIDEVRQALDVVDGLLDLELTTAEQMLTQPDVQSDPKLRGEVEYWISRIKSRQGAVVQARNLLNDPLPIYQYTLPKIILDHLVTAGPLGLEVNDITVTATTVNDWLFYPRKFLDEKYGRGSPVIVPRAALDLITAYTVGSYSMFAHVTMGAQAWQLITGTNEFGDDASRLDALKAIGFNLLIMKLPGAITEYVANRPGWRSPTPGFRGLITDLAPSITLRVPGMGGAAVAGLAGRGGRTLGGDTGGGLQPYPGAARAPAGRPAAGGAGTNRVLVGPDGQIFGRLSVETAGGTLPYPRIAAARTRRGLDPETVRTLQDRELGNVASGPRYVERFQEVNAQIKQLDDAVVTARQRGIADEVIDDILDGVGERPLDEVVAIVESRLDFEYALANRGVFASPQDLAGLAPFATPGQIARVTVVDRVLLESVIAQAHLQASGRATRPPTADEIAYGQDLAGRAEAGQRVGDWQAPSIENFDDLMSPPARRTGTGDHYEGLENLISPDDLAAIRQVFGSGGRFGTPPAGARTTASPFGPRPAGASAAPAQPRPLASLDEYRALVDRQAAGETIDLSNVARPGIARVAGDQIGVVQGAGRWEGTRPGDYLDVFVPADARIPAGVDYRVLETNVPAEIVQQSNLLSSRGAAGTNPPLVNVAVRNIPLWNRIQVRAGQVRAPTSRVAAEIEVELGRLGEAGLDVANLRTAIAGLSPAEQLSVLRDPVRANAIVSGEVPPSARITPVVVDPVRDPFAVGGPSGRGSASAPVRVLVTSTGGSTGPVARMYVVRDDADEDSPPARIVAEGIVLEPVDDPDPATRAAIEEIMEAASGGKTPTREDTPGGGSGPRAFSTSVGTVYSFEIDAYCLERAGGVPTEGTFFRIADAPVQEANARLRAILASSRMLRDLGMLHPDTDPTLYFHSIRQWAIWVDENDLDRAGYEEAFAEHGRRNIEAAGRAWTPEVERTVRSLVPNRWVDIVAILEGAGLAVKT